MDKEILDILKQLQESQSRLEQKFDGLDAGQSRLEEKFDGLDANQSRLEQKVDVLIKTVGAIYDQTANLTEFRTEVNIKLEDLKEVKEVTKENCYEIARIKAVI